MHQALPTATTPRPDAASQARASQAAARPAAARQPELDWLRVGAVFLVFLAHVAQIFSPSEAWHIESVDRSRMLGLFTVLLGPWLMPLFMLVAGAGSWFALQRYDLGGFFRARVLRLLLPLVAGTFVVIPPQMYFRSLARGTFEGSFVAFYPRFFDGIYPEGNFSYGHLWFLAYLFLLMTAAMPALAFLRRPSGRFFMARVAARCRRGVGILWLAVPLALSQIILRVPFTQTTGAIVDDWATHAWFLLVFLYGFALMADRRLLMAVDRQWRRVLVPALATTAFLFVWAWPGDMYARIPGDPSLWYLVWWINFTVGCWAWLVVVLGAARRYLAAPAPALRHWNEAAYPFYILHQPVIIFVAFHIVDWPLAMPQRFAAIALGSLALTGLLLEALRRIPVLRVLVGLPPSRRRQEQQPRAALPVMAHASGDGSPPGVSTRTACQQYQARALRQGR
jgi:glucans biosynthesis protein C